MKRFLKTTLSLALAFIMLAGSIPLSSYDFSGFSIKAEAVALTQSQFDAKLAAAKKLYPCGTAQKIWPMGQDCHGYARWLSGYVWGVDFANGRGDGWVLYKSTSSSSSIEKLRPGDVVRYRTKSTSNFNHTIFITNIKGDTIYFTDCNKDWNSTVCWNTCKDSRTLTKKNLDKYLKIKLYTGWGAEAATYGYIAHYKPNTLGGNSLSINNQTPTTTNTTAHISATITSSVQSYGYYLSTTKSHIDNKDLSKKVVVSNTSAKNTISADISSLTPNTTYYYRFYVKYNDKNYYSSTASFKTSNIAPAAAKIKTSTAHIGINDTATFSWNEAKDADSYFVKIYKNGVLQSTSSEIKGFQYVSNKMTSAGNYEAEIISKNSAKQVVGNRVSFTVHPNLTVTFKDPISGKVIKTEKNVAYGHSATPPKAPEHEGYTFANKWDSDYTNITSDKTITAVYNANTYTVKFVNSVTNAIIKTEKVTYNKSATAPTTVTAPADGYTFKGWDKSFDAIKGDTTVYTVFEWYDSAYPTVVALNSISRNSTKAGYDITVKVTASSTAKNVVSGRVVAALKSSQGALLNSTESSAFALNPGDSKTLSIFVPYDSLAYAVQIYAINNYGSNGTIAQPINTNIDNSSAWSAWIAYSGTVPVTQGVNGVSAVETKSVAGTTTNYYRYKTKATKTSYETAISGWTQDGYSLVKATSGSISYVPSWPSGFNKSNSLYTTYNKTPKTASETATQKTTVSTSTQGYIYWHWCAGYTGGPINRWIEWSKKGSYTKFHAFYNTSAKSYDSSADAYKYSNSSVCKDSYWWNGLKSGSAGLVTVKKCDYTTYNKLYNYYKIYDWSKWTPYTGNVPVVKGTPTNTSGETYYEVETKKETTPTTYYYRYKSSEKVTDPAVSQEQIVNINGTISSQYAGKKAIVWVYKFDQTSDYTTEYVSNEITVGANGEISIQNARLFEAPTIESGDYSIVVSVKGMTESIYLGKIEAPKPKYTVTFYDYDGKTVVSQQIVDKCGSAVVPDPSNLSVSTGYRFTNWSQSTVNVQDNLSVYPEQEKEKYVVAFVDWATHYVELKEFEYGAELITPILEETEEGIVSSWDLSKVPTDGNGSCIVTSNMAVTTKFEPATKNVVFYDIDFNETNTNPQIVSEQNVVYGSRLIVPELHNSVVVTNWVNVEDGSVLGDTTVTNSGAFYPEYYYEETVADPVASVTTGSYSTAQKVTLTCTDTGATIYYTTDGSNPETNGIKYTGPVTISKNTHLSFIAKAQNKNNSLVVDEYYAIKDGTKQYYVVKIHNVDDFFDVMFVEHGKTVTVDTTKYQTSYQVFNGFITADGNKWDISKNVVTSDITLYPDITYKEYTVTFKSSDGSVISTQKVPYGLSAEEPKVTAPSGKAFSGWSSDDYLFVTGDVTVTAKFIPQAQVIKVQLNKSNVLTIVDSQIQLSATVTPDSATNKSVTWYSSDESVVTVDYTGLITAVGAGKAEIMAVSDENGATAICNVTVLNTGHNSSDWIVSKNATCTSSGLKVKQCKDCGVILETEMIPIVAHKYNSGVVTKNATCTVSGVKTFTCSVCKTTKTENLNPTGHSFGSNFIVDKPASFTENGTKSRHCSRCNEKTEITVVPKLTLTVPVVKTANTSNGVVVSWNTVENAEKYIVYSSTYDSKTKKWSSWINKTTLSGATTWTDTGVRSGTKYKYAITPVKGSFAGQFGESSSILYLAQPTVKIANASTGVKVKWNKITGATGYKVYRAEYSNGKWSGWKSVKTITKGSTVSWTDTKAKSGVKYKYTVKAVNGKTGSTYKSSSSLLYLAQPKVAVKALSNGIKVAWVQSAGATSYKIYRSEYNAKTKKWSSWKSIKTAKSTSKLYTDKSAKKGVKYRYTVKAVNGKTASTYKASGSVKR